jgi:hypothetical protein
MTFLQIYKKTEKFVVVVGCSCITVVSQGMLDRDVGGENVSVTLNSSTTP